VTSGHVAWTWRDRRAGDEQVDALDEQARGHAATVLASDPRGVGNPSEARRRDL